MPKLEGIRIRNYRVLHDISLGSIARGKRPLTQLTAVVGDHGTGKSTLLDALAFLSACLKDGLEASCDAHGGFGRLRSLGQVGAIEFEIAYEDNGEELVYKLVLDADRHGRPYVAEESLARSEPGQKNAFFLLTLREGRGYAMRPDADMADAVELADRQKLAIAVLGNLKRYPRLSALRSHIRGWQHHAFSPDAARSLPCAVPQTRLDLNGANLANVVLFLERDHPMVLRDILKDFSGRTGIEAIETEKTADGRLILRFHERAFQTPLFAQHMSDGTLRLLALLLLLHDPALPPLLCLKEPDKGLCQSLLAPLARKLLERAHNTQLLVTAHNPCFVDALAPDTVWLLEKGDNGFAHARRAFDNSPWQGPTGQGSHWYSASFAARE